MQVAENTLAEPVVKSGRKCTVCAHPSVSAINALLADKNVSKRIIAAKYGLVPVSVQRHALNHLPLAVKKAVQRRVRREGDVFMERHEHLFGEALQYVEDAKGAVKMQRVTVEVPKENGDIVLQERYQAFRDVGAMAPALGAATALQRMLGDATNRFESQQVRNAPAIIQVVYVDKTGAQSEVKTIDAQSQRIEEEK